MFVERTHLWHPQVNSGIQILTVGCSVSSGCQDCSGWQGQNNYQAPQPLFTEQIQSCLDSQGGQIGNVNLFYCNSVPVPGGKDPFCAIGECNDPTQGYPPSTECETVSGGQVVIPFQNIGTPYFVTPGANPTCTSLQVTPWPELPAFTYQSTGNYPATGPAPIPYTTEMCLAIQSGCTCTGDDFHYPTTCTCPSAPSYPTQKGVSYNVSCCGVGEHFASYNMEWPSSYSQFCDQLLDTLLQFTFTTPGYNGGLPYQLGLASASELLKWVCYDYSVDLQGLLWSQTNRNCNSSNANATYDRGNLYGWSHPIGDFGSNTLDGTDPFFCCIQQTAQINTASCAIESSCFDSGYCVQTLFDTCSSAKLMNTTYTAGCQAWLAWAASHSTQTNVKIGEGTYRGAYDTSADAAFQSVYAYCAGPGQTQSPATCAALSLTGYTQVFPRTTAIVYSGITTITTESLAIGVTNVSNQQMWTAVVSYDLNPDETTIVPTSLSLSPGQTGAFTVTSTPKSILYTQTRGIQYQDTYRVNLPYWSRDGTAASQEVYEPNWGPNCDANANPYINSFSSLSIASSGNVRDRPPKCFGADEDVTNQYSATWQQPGWFLVQDTYGYFMGWSSVSTLTTASKYLTGNNPWGYDCSTTYYNYLNRTIGKCCQGETVTSYGRNGGYGSWFCPSDACRSGLDPPGCGDCQNAGQTEVGCEVVNFTDSALAIPSYPSCQATQTVPTNGGSVNITQTDYYRWICSNATAVGNVCQSVIPVYGFRDQYFIQTPNQCRSGNDRVLDPFPDAVNGVCDPWAYQMASYSLFRICSATGLQSPHFNILLVDAAEFEVSNYQTVTNKTNRTLEQSRDYPIMGGWLCLFDRAPDFGGNAENYALYAYPLTLDNNFQFFA